MGKLSDMDNIGPTLEQKLINSGIMTSMDLSRMGSKSAYIVLKENKQDVDIETLYSIEAAIEGIRTHELPADIKADLRKFADSEKK